MNRNRKNENKLTLSLIICMMVVMFSCKDNDFDKDYSLVDAGALSVDQSVLTFDANADTKTAKFTALPAAGSIWGYRKSADWISVVQYEDRLEISVTLYEGLTYNDDKKIYEHKDREGRVTLVKEGADGTSSEVSEIKVVQKYEVPRSTDWDNSSVGEYIWEWNGKDAKNVVIPTNYNKAWDSTYVADGNKHYYYVYKIIGTNASNFEQSVNDSIRPNRQIKIVNKEDNTSRDTLRAYLIITDKDSKKIHLRRALKVADREDEFAFKQDEVTVKADSAAVEVEIVALTAKSDSVECKITKIDDNGFTNDWVFLPKDELNKFKSGDKIQLIVAANTSTSDGRQAILELVAAKNGASFNPPVYLIIKQNQKLVY
jgi:hypothetical protein